MPINVKAKHILSGTSLSFMHSTWQSGSASCFLEDWVTCCCYTCPEIYPAAGIKWFVNLCFWISASGVDPVSHSLYLSLYITIISPLWLAFFSFILCPLCLATAYFMFTCQTFSRDLSEKMRGYIDVSLLGKWKDVHFIFTNTVCITSYLEGWWLLK